MKSARRIPLTRLIPLVLAAALALSCPIIGANAAADPIEAFIEISPDTLTAPGSVSVSIRVSNTSNEDLPDPVTLYGPSGSVVPSFGDGGSVLMSAGKSVPWQGALTVTQDMLDSGSVTYTLKYLLEDDEGALSECTRQITAPIAFSGQSVNLSVTRTITPEVARSGKDVSVVYELVNNGNVKINNIRVKETISRTAQTVDSLGAGEQKTLTFTAKMGSAALKSSATITFKAEGETKTTTQKIEETEIPLAKPNLQMTLEAASTGVTINEPVKLILTFKNEGNIDYSGVTVADQNKGEVFSGIEIPAGQTVVKEKEFVLTEPTKFKFTATLNDNTGSANTMSTGEVSVGVYDPEKTLLLTLNLTSDMSVIHKMPSDARFTLVVTNNSDVKAEKVKISHGVTEIDTIDAIAPGGHYTLTRDVTLSEAGKYQFTASTKDALNNTVEFKSNVVDIAYARPTAVPTAVPTVAVPQLVTIAPPTAGDVDPLVAQGSDALKTASIILGVVFVGMLALLAVSSVIRARNRKLSEDAYDHLDLAERRVYTEPADDELPETPAEPEEVRAESAYEDATAESDTALPHERLLRDADPLPDADEQAPAPEEPAVTEQTPEAPEQDAPAGESTARRRRAGRARKTEDDE